MADSKNTQHHNVTHGQNRRGKPTRTYRVWRSMWKRCTLPHHPYYRYYGGAGITVCERWRRFESFYEDMGECRDGMSIDRIDNACGYDPSNCRWATMKDQQRNRSNSVLLTLNGVTMNLVDWADRVGIDKSTLSRRIRRLGWSTEKALTTPVGTIHRWSSRIRRP